jgi:hypothetical protein
VVSNNQSLAPTHWTFAVPTQHPQNPLLCKSWHAAAGTRQQGGFSEPVRATRGAVAYRRPDAAMHHTHVVPRTRPWHACRQQASPCPPRRELGRDRDACKSAQRSAAAEHQPETHRHVQDSPTPLDVAAVAGGLAGLAFPAGRATSRVSSDRSAAACCLHVVPPLLPLPEAGARRRRGSDGRTGAR